MKPIVTADGTNYATLTIGTPSSDGNVYEDIYALANVPLDEGWREQANLAIGWRGVAAPRWIRLRQRRREKAAAKRTKMRAARYAARWEQAHLRGGK